MAAGPAWFRPFAPCPRAPRYAPARLRGMLAALSRLVTAHPRTIAATDEGILALAAPHGIRLIALDQLGEAQVARDALEQGHSDGALHDFRVGLRRLRSWLRAFRDDLAGTAGRRYRRRLRAVSRATSPQRDVEVQIQWLRSARGRLPTRRHRGADWLVHHFEERKHGTASAVDVEALGEFDAARRELESRLCVVEPLLTASPAGASLSHAIAVRVAPHAQSLQEKLAGITSADDEVPAHRARIAAKRLRYLVEPAVPHVKGGAELLLRLKRLQDELGGLHDAHVLGHELQDAPIPDAPRGGVTRVADRLRDQRNATYRAVEHRWMNGNAAPFFRDLERFAERLHAAHA